MGIDATSNSHLKEKVQALSSCATSQKVFVHTRCIQLIPSALNTSQRNFSLLITRSYEHHHVWGVSSLFFF